MKKIILTPLTTTSLANYQHEIIEADNFRTMMWDGEVNGKDQVGDLFGWVNIKKEPIGDLAPKTIRVTRVTNVLGGSAARRHWNDPNKKHTLVLDCFYKDIDYDLWLSNAKRKDGKPYQYSTALHSGTKRFDWPF